jgi:hypothetical protein
MISTIFIDTERERLFPLAGNTREAVAEFVKNQIDLSFIALSSPIVIKQLQPHLSEAQVQAVLSKLLTIPLMRRENIGPYEFSVEEIFLHMQSHRDFIVSGWEAIYGQEKLPAEIKGKKVVHAFGEAIAREFFNACQMIIQLGVDEGISMNRSADLNQASNF